MTDDAVVWRGPDELRPLLVPLATLQMDPQNANTHPPKNLDTIRGSLADYGQQKPIVVTPESVIVAGNGLWLALGRPIDVLGPNGEVIGEEQWTHVAVVRSDLPPAKLVGYGITDNRSQQLSEWDRDQLAQLLGGMNEDGVDLARLGWDEADLARLFDGGGPFDPNAEWAGMPEYDQDDRTPAFRVTVNFVTDEDADQFFERIGRPRKPILWWPDNDGLVSKDAGERYVTDE